MDNIQVTHNNDNHHYRIAMDIAKEGSSLWDLTPYVKGRVGDNRFGLQVTWTYQGQLMNVEGMKPYIEGNVGQYSVDDKNNLQLDPNSGVVRYVGDPADCQAGGQVTYYFPEQMFPKEGIFKGYIGLLDDRDDSKNPHISGVTVWFKVLPGIAEMGHACDYYISDLEKAEEIFKAKLRQHEADFQSEASKVISDARNSYTTEVSNAHDALLALQSQISANRDEQNNLVQRLVEVEHQIAIQDIIKRPEFNTKIEQEANERQQGDNDLTERLNNLLTAATGKDNSGPEIVDARIASTSLGKGVAKTLGESIRSQIDKIYLSHQTLSNFVNQTFASNDNKFEAISQNSILSQLMRQSGFQLIETNLLDASGEPILDENNNLIDAEEISELTDKSLTLPNVAADAAEVGRLLKNTKAKNQIYGGDFLLSSPIPSPHVFRPEDGTNVGLVVQPSTDASKFDSGQVESPSIIFDDAINKYIMVYTAYTKDSKASIGYAYSDDLKTWEPQGQLFHCSGDHDKGDQYGCTGPCLVKYDGLYWLFYLGLNGVGYEGQPINMCLASSPNLKDWDYRGIVIPIQNNISWANTTIYHPCVMRINGTWIIFFNAFGYINGQGHERVGFAYSDNIDGQYTVDPTRISEFAEKAGNQTSSIECGDPSVFKLNGLYYMFYFDTCHGDEIVDRYGWTTPAEFPRGWRYGGKVINNDQPYNKTYAHKPFVIIKDNTLYHFYTAVGDSGRCIALQTFELN